MATPLLFLVLALAPQQSDLDQIRQELQQQRQQMTRLAEAIDKQSQTEKQATAVPLCSAEVRMAGGAAQRIVPLNAAAVVPFNLFSVVTKPIEHCLTAEFRVTAAYLDAAGDLICSGVVESAATQRQLAESINLEIRPWNLREFVRWRNEPPEINSGAKRLTCINAEGLSEVRSEELARVGSVRVRATVLPQGGGMSTSEIVVTPR
jgi:hypothetical protein